ncbi:unnamed protein product [Moneuplotes crassus]|uniref:Uncharacterized protein n=1 Tax=Euplotes crassus TaxID=5936 RepID=A0AAD1Y679_EUPCR|nr:unnamed protein product [Moneuplotes crassus]
MGAKFWPVPKSIVQDAYIYPKRYVRNVLFLGSGLVLCGIQFFRFTLTRTQPTMMNGEYMDWGSHHAPKKLRY